MQVDRNLFGGLLTQTANVARRMTGKSTLDEAYYQEMMQSSQEFYDSACTAGIWEAALIVPVMGGSTVTGGTAPAVVTNSGQVVSGANSATLVAAPHIVFSKNEDETDQPKDIKMVKDNYLKQKGFDAHEIKESIVGKKNISKFDIYVDKDTGQLWVYRKGGKGKGIATGEYIK